MMTQQSVSYIVRRTITQDSGRFQIMTQTARSLPFFPSGNWIQMGCSCFMIPDVVWSTVM